MSGFVDDVMYDYPHPANTVGAPKTKPLVASYERIGKSVRLMIKTTRGRVLFTGRAHRKTVNAYEDLVLLQNRAITIKD